MDQRPDAQKSCAFSAGFFFWALVFAGLAPWLLIRIQQATNSDVLWLCEALSRIFSGLTMSSAAYETNPPLSMLIYTLPVLAQSIFHIPLHYAVFIQTLLLIGMAAYAIHSLLNKWDIFPKNFVDVLTAAFILMNTCCTSLFFSERDHMIALCLVPFVLMQVAITFRRPIPKYLQLPVLILGTILILVKPHHGLIPALMILYRFFKRKNLSPIKDADFLALASGCILYAATALYFFPDYFTVILPDVINLYLPVGKWDRVAVAILTSFICFVIMIIGMLYTPSENKEKSIGLFLAVCGLVSLIPFYVQGIGFYYHLIPALSFFMMAYAAALFMWFQAALPKKNPAIACFMILLIFSYAHTHLNSNFPTHGQYKNLTLPRYLSEHCPDNKKCSFYMTNLNMGVIHEVAYYTGMHHASRFPALWFWPPLEDKTTALSKEEVLRLKLKYTEMIAEDLSQQKPDFLVLLKNKDANDNFIPHFNNNKDFAEAIRPYKKIDTIHMSYDEYYPQTGAPKELLDYEIYKRTKP